MRSLRLEHNIYSRGKKNPADLVRLADALALADDKNAEVEHVKRTLQSRIKNLNVDEVESIFADEKVSPGAKKIVRNNIAESELSELKKSILDCKEAHHSSELIGKMRELRIRLRTITTIQSTVEDAKLAIAIQQEMIAAKLQLIQCRHNFKTLALSFIILVELNDEVSINKLIDRAGSNETKRIANTLAAVKLIKKTVVKSRLYDALSKREIAQHDAKTVYDYCAKLEDSSPEKNLVAASLAKTILRDHLPEVKMTINQVYGLYKKYKLNDTKTLDSMNEHCIRVHGVEKVFLYFLNETDEDIQLSLATALLKNDRLFKLAEITQSKPNNTDSLEIIAIKQLLTLIYLLSHHLSLEQIKMMISANQVMIDLVGPAINELLADKANIEILGSIRNKRHLRQFDESFFNELLQVKNIRNMTQDKALQTYLDHEITQASKAISDCAIKSADAFHSITSGKADGILEQKTNREKAKPKHDLRMTWGLSGVSTAAYTVQRVVEHKEIRTQIQAADKQKEINLIHLCTDTLVEVNGEQSELTVNTLKEMARIDLANAVQICLTSTNIKIQAAFADILLSNTESLKVIMPNQEIDKLIDILAATKPVKVYELFRTNPELANPILKSQSMLHWLFKQPIKKDELNALIKPLNDSFNADRGLPALLTIFSHWNAAQFKQALHTLESNYSNVLRWGLLSRNTIIASLKPDALDAYLQPLMPSLTRKKIAGLTRHWNFERTPKTETSLRILLGRFPLQTVEYLEMPSGQRTIDDSLNHKKIAFVLLNELDTGYWKLPEAKNIHDILNPSLHPRNKVDDLIELGVYNVDGPYLTPNKLVTKRILADLKKQYILPNTRNFLKIATTSAFRFVLNDESILAQLSVQELARLYDYAIEKNLAPNDFKLIGQIYGSNPNLLNNFLNRSKNYQPHSRLPSKTILAAMFVGAMAGTAAVLTRMKEYIPHLLFAAAAGVGIGSTLGLVALFATVGAIVASATTWLAIKAGKSIINAPRKFWNWITGTPNPTNQNRNDAILFHNILRHTPVDTLRKNILLYDGESKLNFYKTMLKCRDLDYKLENLPKETREFIYITFNKQKSDVKKANAGIFGWIYNSIVFPLANWIWDIEKKYSEQLNLVNQLGQAVGALPPASPVIVGAGQAQIRQLLPVLASGRAVNVDARDQVIVDVRPEPVAARSDEHVIDVRDDAQFTPGGYRRLL